MKKLLILSALSITTLGFSQNNCEALKKENEALISTNKVLVSENDYLKKIVEINKAILETEKDNSSFKITKVTGNKAEKTISITFLVEAKDENKKMTIEGISIVENLSLIGVIKNEKLINVLEQVKNYDIKGENQNADNRKTSNKK